MNTTTRLTILLVALLGAGSVAACTPKETPGTAEAGAVVASSTAMATASSSASAAASVAPVTLANDPLPSHGEVAKKVREEITKANYKAELEKIEKEAE